MVSSGCCLFVDTCREGDAPASVRAHRGTTSLAVLPLPWYRCFGTGALAGRPLIGRL